MFQAGSDFPSQLYQEISSLIILDSTLAAGNYHESGRYRERYDRFTKKFGLEKIFDSRPEHSIVVGGDHAAPQARSCPGAASHRSACGEIARSLLSEAPDKDKLDLRDPTDIAVSLPHRSWQLKGLEPETRDTVMKSRRPD